MEKRIKLILFVAIFVFSFVFSSFSYAQYGFFSGKDWLAVDKQSYTQDVKKNIKVLFLQAVQDASLFSGSPVIEKEKYDIEAYVSVVDEFYSKQENLSLPLYFAFKIAEMTENNLPQGQINAYKNAIMQKLNATASRSENGQPKAKNSN
jgi:hypothetical protein